MRGHKLDATAPKPRPVHTYISSRVGSNPPVARPLHRTSGFLMQSAFHEEVVFHRVGKETAENKGDSNQRPSTLL